MSNCTLSWNVTDDTLLNRVDRVDLCCATENRIIHTGCLQMNGAVSKVNKKEGPVPIASCTVSNIAAYATPPTPLFLASPIPWLDVPSDLRGLR